MANQVMSAEPAVDEPVAFWMTAVNPLVVMAVAVTVQNSQFVPPES